MIPVHLPARMGSRIDCSISSYISEYEILSSDYIWLDSGKDVFISVKPAEDTTGLYCYIMVLSVPG